MKFYRASWTHPCLTVMFLSPYFRIDAFKETHQFTTGTRSHFKPAKRILFIESTRSTCSPSLSPLPKSLKVDSFSSRGGLSKSMLMILADFINTTSRLHEVCVVCVLYKSLLERHDRTSCGTLKSYGACFCCFRVPYISGEPWPNKEECLHKLSAATHNMLPHQTFCDAGSQWATWVQLYIGRISQKRDWP